MNKDDFLKELIARKEELYWRFATTLNTFPPTFTTKFTKLSIEEDDIRKRVQLNITKTHAPLNTEYKLYVHVDDVFIGMIEDSDLKDKTLLKQLYTESSDTPFELSLEEIAKAPLWDPED